MDEEHPARPPYPELLNRQPKSFKPVVYGLVISSVVFALVFLAAPLFLRNTTPRDQIEATSNARQIGLVLFEFETQYKAFPNASTIPLVEKWYRTGTDLSGTSSNALFRQIFASEIAQSEQMFHAKLKNSIRPDDDISSGHLLEPGECGFSYISGLSPKDDPKTPIVLTPLIPGTTKFDPKPFDGKAVILHIDNSVRAYEIHKDGHIYQDGINLLSPTHPIWGDKGIPKIHYPE